MINFNTSHQSEPYPEERRLVTVLFADLEGFTSLAEQMDYEDVGDLIRAIWFTLDKVIEKYGGYIDKHMGDSFMVVWGTPVAHEDDAERAVRAGLELQKALKEFIANSPWKQAKRLKLRVGINSGPVLAGYVGLRGEYTVMGDTVNVANRLEELAPPGSVVVSESTYRLVRGAFRFRRLSPLEARGKTEPIFAYLVEQLLVQTGTIRYRSTGGLETNLVGREAELAQLMTLYRHTMRTQSPYFALVVGDAGIGKSRLMMELTRKIELEEPSLKLLSSRALEEMAKVPFYLWKSLWHNLFDVLDDDSPKVAREKFLRGVHAIWGKELGPVSAVEAAHYIGDLTGLSWPDSPYLDATRSSPDAQLHKAFTICRELLRRICQQRPLLLLLDDLQWADSSSLELLGYLLRKEPKSSPLFILGGTRPELLRQHPKLTSLGSAITLQPVPFDPEMVALAYPSIRSFPASVRAELAKMAEGNPYFLEEMVKSLAYEGLINKQLPADQLIAHIRKKLPSSLTALLQARLDALSRDARSVALLASVVGRVFWVGAVVAAAKHFSGTTSLLKGPKEGLLGRIQAALEELTQAELAFPGAGSVFAGEEQYIFKHTLLRDVAYGLLPRKYLRKSHLAVARWLAARAGPDLCVLIANHFEKAGELDRALTYYRLGFEHDLAHGATGEVQWLQQKIERLQQGIEELASS